MNLHVHGNKSYACSIGLALAGILFLLFPPSATWSNPSASVSVTIGTLLLGLAALGASLRHAIAQLRAVIHGLLDELERLLKEPD